MDSLHAIGFYVSAALSFAGGLSLPFLSTRTRRAAALFVVGLGVAGAYASLSAGFVGLVTLVCYAGIALLLARPDYRAVETERDAREAMGGSWRQIGAVGAAALLAALAYAVYRGDFAHGTFSGGPIESAAVARLLFTHDALATLAVGSLVLVALVGAAVAWRRERPRDDRARDVPSREQRTSSR